MDKNDAEKTGQDEPRLAVSDWVTFLSSEKYGTLGSIISIGAFLLAALAIILATETNPVARLTPVCLFGVYAIWFLFWRLGPFQTRGKLAENILDRIMRGELKGESNIREEWTNRLATQEQRRRRQLKRMNPLKWKEGKSSMSKNKNREKLEAKALDLVKRMGELAAPAKQKLQLSVSSLADISRLHKELGEILKQLEKAMFP
jgi:hypothetical protein